MKKVSVIIPILNEELYIKQCLNTCLNQDYSKNHIEFLLIDGGSTDKTLEIIETYRVHYPDTFRIIYNKKKYTPYALNLGIDNSKGEYILIMASHSDYANDFITKNVELLNEIDTDIIGGVTETKSRTTIGNAMSIVLSSKFGVGNSNFRTGGADGYVDTVFCGACRRETYQKYGKFNCHLLRNQDLEFNKRVVKQGGKIYLSNKIKLTYYTPDTLKGNLMKAFNNGKWNIYTMDECPGIISMRHLIPLLFVSSLFLIPLLSLYIPMILYVFIVEIILYLILDIAFSIYGANSSMNLFLLPFLFVLFHISYGLGSLIGVMNVIKSKFRRKEK